MTNNKLKAFAKEYIIDLNATQAAIRAGYSPKTAKQQALRLMNRPDVQQEIQQAMTERQQRTNITADYVLTNLKNVAERCMQAEPVMVRDGKDWIESGEYKFDSSGANRALELLGKHLKLFTDKHEHTGANGGPIEFGIKLPEDIDDE